jgi:hypothetical protein
MSQSKVRKNEISKVISSVIKTNWFCHGGMINTVVGFVSCVLCMQGTLPYSLVYKGESNHGALNLLFKHLCHRRLYHSCGCWCVSNIGLLNGLVSQYCELHHKTNSETDCSVLFFLKFCSVMRAI